LASAEDVLRLTPAQQNAADRLLAAIAPSSVLTLRGRDGMGKTTILNYVSHKTGGLVIDTRDFYEKLTLKRPDAIEEAFVEAIEYAVAEHEIVIVDDLHLVTGIVNNCRYTRQGLLDAALEGVARAAEAHRRTVLYAANEAYTARAFQSRAWFFEIGDFTVADYAFLCEAMLPAHVAARLDYAKIHRFAPALSARQLRNACRWPGHTSTLDTELFIAYLSSNNMTSNVDIDEVQPVTWRDLKGMDDVIEALEAKIILPFENIALSAELELKPKRGVLLAGPPGTGKTTIGRALAHRLKGKFFLVDGTVIAESEDFFDTLRDIFQSAKQNAPSVIFIDDTDLIFENNGTGFYRYLLTMLDGLESASAERVCVMMTAMEVSSIPAAMLRSGRVELWLETRLPDETAREAIFRDRLSKLSEPVRSADIALLATASRGLTGADLKAVVEDGKLLFAHDKVRGRHLRAVEEYFLDAIRTVRENRRSYRRKKPAQLTEPVGFGFAG
jgi:ATP-dependent 26S proteasome regulatory subunit